MTPPAPRLSRAAFMVELVEYGQSVAAVRCLVIPERAAKAQEAMYEHQNRILAAFDTLSAESAEKDKLLAEAGKVIESAANIFDEEPQDASEYKDASRKILAVWSDARAIIARLPAPKQGETPQ